MSHGVTPTGRLYVECDNVHAGTRCARRSYGTRDSANHRAFLAQMGQPLPAELDLFALPRDWSVAPYSDGFRHDVRHIFDDPRRGEVIPGHPLAGVTGDLHTCPACDRVRVSA